MTKVMLLEPQFAGVLLPTKTLENFESNLVDVFHVVVFGGATDDDAAQVAMIAPRLGLIRPLDCEPLSILIDVFFLAATIASLFLVQPQVAQQESLFGESFATEFARERFRVAALLLLGLF